MAENQIRKALEFAKRKHAGQKRDDGTDYFEHHVLRVADIITTLYINKPSWNPNIVAAALLHDTLEDTDTTYNELEKEFGKEVANLVVEVTHKGQADEKGYYFPHLHSREAIIIKFADRLCNLASMDCWSKERQQHYLKKSKFWKSSSEERL